MIYNKVLQKDNSRLYLLLFILLNLVDCAFTLYLLQDGQEIMPIMKKIIEYGHSEFIVFKILITIFIASILWLLRDRISNSWIPKALFRGMALVCCVGILSIILTWIGD